VPIRWRVATVVAAISLVVAAGLGLRGPRLPAGDVLEAGFDDMQGRIATPLPAADVRSLAAALDATWWVPDLASRACYPMMDTDLEIVTRGGPTYRVARVWQCPHTASSTLMEVTVDGRGSGTVYGPRLAELYRRLALGSNRGP
jgi:hypothetical protein